MEVPFFKIVEKLTKEDILRVHLFFLCIKLGFYPEKSELDLLIELYTFGPISSKEKNKEFLNRCVEKKIRASVSSARNVLSKYTNNGILIKHGNAHRAFNIDILSKPSEVIAVQYLLTNYENKS